MQHVRKTRVARRLAYAAACAFIIAISATGEAFGADAACFEGESMSENSTAISVESDTNASGRCPTGGNKALAYEQTGETASQSVTFSSVAEKVEIRVRGVDTNGAPTLPKVRVFVDGEDYALDKVLDEQVTSSYTTLKADLTRSVDKAAGNHTIHVKMANRDNGDKIWVDWIAFTYTSVADTKPPDTSITGGPAEGAVLNTGDATFQFSGTDDNAVAYYEVKNIKNGVDDTFVRATSPKAYTGLSDGSYSFRVRAVDAAGNADPTPAVRNYSVASSPVTSNRIKVTDFGATTNDATNDTAAFEKAMTEAAKANGVAYVPAPGTYRISGVTPPNNAHLQVQAGVVLKKYGTAGGPLFNVGGPNDTTFRENVHIEGVGGNFTIDLNDAGQETSAIRYRNVRHFSLKNMVCRQNWDNHTQEAPSSRRTCLTFLPTTSTPTNGVYNHPTDGTFENIHSKESPYGWGLTQLTGGQNLRFFNISSEGGVALRLESYRGNWTPIDNIVADGVTCTNGHDAVHVNPHDGTHGTITVRNVVANSCESAVRLGNESTLEGSFASDSTINGVTVVPGIRAQLRDPAPNGYVGAWVIGPSKWSIDNDKPLGYTMGLSNVDDGGLGYRRP